MADTQQSVSNPQATGSNLQPVRSDLQPTSTQNSQLGQTDVNQQNLPVTKTLTVQHAEQGSPLPSGVAPGNPTQSTSLVPFLIVLAAVLLFIMALAIWAMRPRAEAEIMSETVAPAKASKPKAKKATSKAKPRKKKTKKRS
jgi:hypothetical protein